ncbi:hypothetical protein HDU79_008653 [Rhizoclosmatium sp. JEL0117]|nr:hypothetical protein HDU79_008653 [Rhizoclosmatium sp. JEL0117]
MHPTTLLLQVLLLLSTTTFSAPLVPNQNQNVNQKPLEINTLESATDAAKIAVSLLSESLVIGELATIASPTGSTNKVKGHPIATLESIWVNNCQDASQNKDPWLALVSWGVHATNIKHDNKVSVHIRDKYFYTRPNHDDERGLLNHPRFTLFGRLEEQESTRENVACMLEKHPGAEEWFTSHSFKLFKVVTEGPVYFLGGYGGLHYVGWVPEDVYRGVALGMSSVE